MPDSTAVNGPHGPRASIVKIGVCEPLGDHLWFTTGWLFNTRGDPSLFWPCPFVHDEAGAHIGYLGWLFTDLQALSAAEFELDGLESVDPRS